MGLINLILEFSLAMLIFFCCFLIRIMRLNKKLGPCAIFGLFGHSFRFSLFLFLFLFFFNLGIYNDDTYFSCNIHLKGYVKTFNLTIFSMLFHLIENK